MIEALEVKSLCNYNETMINLTLRNIPDETLEKIKTLSVLERRSLNSEMLTVLERGLRAELESASSSARSVGKSTQVHIWEQLSGKWEDSRSTEELVRDIYENRSLGREVDL